MLQIDTGHMKEAKNSLHVQKHDCQTNKGVPIPGPSFYPALRYTIVILYIYIFTFIFKTKYKYYKQNTRNLSKSNKDSTVKAGESGSLEDLSESYLFLSKWSNH